MKTLKDHQSLEDARSELLSKLEEFQVLDDEYLELFKNNSGKFDQCANTIEKTAINKIIQMQKESAHACSNTIDQLLKAKNTNELNRIFWGFKNEMTKLSSIVNSMDEEMRKKEKNDLEDL